MVFNRGNITLTDYCDAFRRAGDAPNNIMQAYVFCKIRKKKSLVYVKWVNSGVSEWMSAAKGKEGIAVAALGVT